MFALVHTGLTQPRFVSLGAEFSVPTADLSDSFQFGIGFSALYTHGFSTKFSGIAHTGIIFFQTKDNDALLEDLQSFYFQIPIQAGIRYHPKDPREGIWAGLMAGVNFQDVFFGNGEALDEKDGFFSLAPDIGYFISPRFSIGLRYQMTFIPERYEDFTVTVMGENGIPELQERTEVRESEILTYLGFRIAYHL